MGKEEHLLAQGPSVPTFKEAVKNDKKEFDDCTPCRIVGSAVFIGGGIAAYVNGQSQLTAQEAAILKSNSRFGMASRRAGITGLAVSMVGLGVYRFFA